MDGIRYSVLGKPLMLGILISESKRNGQIEGTTATSELHGTTAYCLGIAGLVEVEIWMGDHNYGRFRNQRVVSAPGAKL